MIKIYGESSETIVVEGDINKRFHNIRFMTETTYLLVSTGTVIAVSRSVGGHWNVHPSCLGRAAISVLLRGGHPNYSGITIEGDGDIEWVTIVPKESLVFKKKPKAVDKVKEQLELTVGAPDGC